MIHQNKISIPSFSKLFPVLAFSALLSACSATLYIVTDTLTVAGKTAIVRASSEFKGPKNSPTVYQPSLSEI